MTKTSRNYRAAFRGLLLVIVLLVAAAQSLPAATPEYRIDAIRYGSLTLPTSTFIATAGDDEQIDAAMVVWLIRGNDRTILFDSGFHRETLLETYPVTDYVRPDKALELAGVEARDVTDVIVSHAHWDHMGGIDLFPNARIWIQKAEYDYYTSDAWQPGGKNDVIDPQDVINLVKLNTEGRVVQIAGDNIEIMPGITAYTGGRHTYASQYVRIEGSPTYVLASDNCYLYRNLEENEPVAITFAESDRETNREALKRMQDLAGSPRRVVPGHDPKQFDVFPTHGRIAQIK